MEVRNLPPDKTTIAEMNYTELVASIAANMKKTYSPKFSFSPHLTSVKRQNRILSRKKNVDPLDPLLKRQPIALQHQIRTKIGKFKSSSFTTYFGEAKEHFRATKKVIRSLLKIDRAFLLFIQQMPSTSYILRKLNLVCRISYMARDKILFPSSEITLVNGLMIENLKNRIAPSLYDIGKKRSNISPK